MKKILSLFSHLKVIITGFFAWIFLAFSTLKLSVIYAPNPVLAYLIVYNIASIVFLLYFYAYLKQKFNNKTFLLIFSCYNVGVHLFDLLYAKLVLIYSEKIDFSFVLTNAFINLIVLFVSFVIIKKINKTWNHTS